MKTIKTFYKASFAIILILYFILLYIFLKECYQIGDILELTAIFVALLTGLLAIAISDKKTFSIVFKTEVFGNIQKDREEHKTSDLDESIRDHFTKYGDIFYSYRVNFKITNNSELVLKRPTITIKIPIEVKHPSQDKRNIEARSNMFNSTNFLQYLEFGDTVILSNSNIPFLHQGESIKIWIRMRLDKENTSPMTFQISLDSENAEGTIQKITMSPKEILEARENKN